MKKLILLLAFVASFAANAAAPPIPPPAPYNPYPTYLGQVATRATIQDSRNASFKQTMSRSLHIARDNISALQIGVANWYVGSGAAEAGSGATMSVTAQIEYPVGTCTQVTFGGSGTGSIANNVTGISDLVALTTPIPRGATFFVRKWESTTSAIVFNSIHNIDLANGETFNYGVTATDQTACSAGTPTNIAGNTTNSSQPVAILAYTNRPSVFLTGDSRAEGQKDSISDNGDDVGEFARAIGPYYAYINTGASGDTVLNVITGSNYANRLALSQYCTQILSNYGVNDLYGGAATAATVWANLQTFYAYFLGKPIIQATIWPEITSTDNYTSVTGQAMSSATVQAQRVALNKIIRPAPYPLIGMVDDASAIETSLNSGLWNTAGSIQITAGTYTSGTGAFTTTTAVAHNIQVGQSFYVYLVTTGSLNPYYAFVTATTGTTGTVLNWTDATGLGITTISNGAVNSWTRDGTHATPVGYIAIKNYNQPLLRAIIGGKQ